MEGNKRGGRMETGEEEEAAGKRERGEKTQGRETRASVSAGALG